MGVTKVGHRKYRARYSLHGKRYNVGTFKTKKEASLALGEHYWNNDNLMALEDNGKYIPLATDPKVVNNSIRIAKPTFKERVISKWQSFRKSLEERNLI